jgi:hypothetical protein
MMSVTGGLIHRLSLGSYTPPLAGVMEKTRTGRSKGSSIFAPVLQADTVVRAQTAKATTQRRAANRREWRERR